MDRTEQSEKEERELAAERPARKPAVVDKRRVGKGGPSAEPSTKPAYAQQLEEKVARLEAAFTEKLAEMEEETTRSRQRLLGDLERRFASREEDLLLEVLALLDDLGRATAMTEESPAVRQGLDLVAQGAARFLERHQCERISPLGQPFDPHTMEAVQLLPGEKDQVVQVLEAGIRRGDKMLRHARVAVGSGATPARESSP